MKEIKAYIKPHRLSRVTLALREVRGLTGMTIMDVRGFGRTRAKDAPHRIVDDLIDYVPRIKIEIICRDELVENIVSVIEEHAHTGLQGDGKIFVSSIEKAVRISTGERGEAAV